MLEDGPLGRHEAQHGHVHVDAGCRDSQVDEQALRTARRERMDDVADAQPRRGHAVLLTSSESVYRPRDLPRCWTVRRSRQHARTRRPGGGSIAAGAFIAAATTVGYTYIGYPLLIRAAATRRRRRTSGRCDSATMSYAPAVTVVIPACDEAAVIATKIDNTRSLTYPRPLEIIVVADGSTDGTERITRELGVKTLFEP